MKAEQAPTAMEKLNESAKLSQSFALLENEQKDQYMFTAYQQPVFPVLDPSLAFQLAQTQQLEVVV